MFTIHKLLRLCFIIHWNEFHIQLENNINSVDMCAFLTVRNQNDIHRKLSIQTFQGTLYWNMNICTRRKYESKIEKKWAEVVQENDIYDKSFSTMNKQKFANIVWAISHQVIWTKFLFAVLVYSCTVYIPAFPNILNLIFKIHFSLAFFKGYFFLFKFW